MADENEGADRVGTHADAGTVMAGQIRQMRDEIAGNRALIEALTARLARYQACWEAAFDSGCAYVRARDADVPFTPRAAHLVPVPAAAGI